MILIVRRSAVIELKGRGHRLVSAANRGGEGFDTNGTQKNDCREVGMDFPTVVVSCNL